MTIVENFFKTMYQQGVFDTVSFSLEKKIVIFIGHTDFKYLAMSDNEIANLVNLCFNCGFKVRNEDENLKFKIIKQEE